ncbi:beta-3 adrenergic receptor-like isoform X1 [Bombus vosnesenskii]|uniref:Beta-3 adrenergic receptor-like isoform X1 n=1 Tax=Bombus vosnesenskii TaxID=207650 RepID=A0A6J3L716_9HYME|nr:beta-3 adrenergic receptor-like isoform X1 [Bombus vosnesenskii]XP_033361416.1 beta-3 adrenergic receptor-like isoform X1 [Bombus vosnesenskii]XP_033361418.1 beta-3 adrenergic receptor-like isoform X1 [Bombus vosnesenskii]
MVPWAFGVPLVFVSALGLILNGFVLLVVLGLGKQTQQQQTANTLLLIHLGAVEAAVCLILLIFTTGSWPIAGTWCVLHGFLLTLLHPVALWTVTGLNCDRYYAIAAPLHYAALVSPRRVAVGLAASWTGALFLCVLPFWGLVPPYRYSPGLGCCAPDFSNDSWGLAAALYGAVYAILGLALPAILVTICNLRVLGIARYHRHRIASAIYEVTLSAQATITHQRNPFFVPTVTAPSVVSPPRFHSAAKTVMQLVGSLYLLYFPYCGLILWEVCDVGNQPHFYDHPKLASLASLLLACSPPINGLLYGLKSQTLRRSVQNYWRKKATKSELQQEIQARTPSVAGSRRPSGSGTGSFFPFPPLQRRLSEALLALGSCRTGNSFDSNNLGFHRSRLQPAASCNTLRVPTSESGESSKLVRSSASAASLMGPHYRSDFIGVDVSAGCSIAMNETPRRSPRILITRAYSEDSQDGGSPLLRKPILANALPCEKRRWRHCSTGSDSSTGSSETSVWTTGVAQKLVKANVKSASDMWPASRRFVRGKNLEEGPLLVGARPSNNSESSDTTDTTATTTTTTMPSKQVAMENGGYREKEKEKINGNKKEGQQSESDNSWSSVDEIESKEMADKSIEEDNFEKIEDREADAEKCKQLRRKSKTIRKPDVPQNCKETAQRRPLLTSSS